MTEVHDGEDGGSVRRDGTAAESTMDSDRSRSRPGAVIAGGGDGDWPADLPERPLVVIRRLLRPLAAVPGALHAPRMVLALLLVAIIGAAGGLWDALRGERIPRSSLVSDGVSDGVSGPVAPALVPLAVHSGADGDSASGVAMAREPALRRIGAAAEESATAASVPSDGPATHSAAGPAGELGERRRGAAGEASAQPLADGSFAHAAETVARGVSGLSRSVITLQPAGALAALRDVIVGLPVRLFQHDPVFLAGFGILVILLTGLLGGAIARIAAIEHATDERVRAIDGLLFASATWTRLGGALLAPVVGIAIVAILLLGGGALLKLPGTDVIAGLLYGIALLLGLGAALLIVGTAIVFPLLIPAVAAERADALEALQRSIAYLLARPVQLALIGVVAIVGLGVGYLLVAGFVAVALNFTNACVGAWSPATEAVLPTDRGPFALRGIDRAEALEGITTRATAALLVWWQGLLVALVAAWVVSYFFSASTIAYLSAREAVDGQAPDEIWRPGHADGTSVPGFGAPRRGDLPAIVRAASRVRPIGSLLFALLLCCGCESGGKPVERPPDFEAQLEAQRRTVDQVVAWMSGAFTSEAQALRDPAFRAVALHMMPIDLPTPALRPERWLYVEQAMMSAPERPYRQRVYRITAAGDDVVSDVYEFMGDPLRFAGAWADRSRLAGLQIDDLVHREGCAVRLSWSGSSWIGRTEFGTCASTRDGAAFATSEVELADGSISSWDRGFDAAGAQVWGSRSGPYQFQRIGAASGS